ncbi:MAG: DUF7159 family protein [Mycobacterium sp.]
MEIALGISMTPATIRMVLVEGDKADGLLVEYDQFPTRAAPQTVATSASEQVSAAILATQQSASRQGHNLSMRGIAVSAECDADDLRESLAARGLGDVVMVSEPQAAAALAHTVARAVGYTKTALLFVQERAATLSVVDNADHSVVEEVSRSLQSADANYVLKEMFAGFTAEGAQGLFVVDSSGRLPIIKPCLEAATSLPTIFPEEPEWALARGAALAAAAAPRFEPSTTGLAYAQDPDEEDSADPAENPTGPLAPADEATKRGLLAVIRRGSTGSLDMGDRARSSAGRFVPVGSLAASVVVIGVVAVVMALAASTSPTATEHLIERGQILPTEPSTIAAPTPPAPYQAAAAPNPAPLQLLPAPPPPAPTADAVQQSPLTIAAEAPASRVQTARPVAAAQAPVTAEPAAAAPVEPPREAAPDPVDPPAAAAPVPVAAPSPQIPAFTPSAPAVQVPQFSPQITLGPPVSQAPAVVPQAPFLRWLPAFLRPQQQAPVVAQAPVPQAPAPQWPQSQPAQQWTPPAQQWTPPAQQWTPPVQQWTPPAQQWTPPAQQWTPPAQQWTPPAQQWTPPAQQWTPPAAQVPQSPQYPSSSGGFGAGSRGGPGGGVRFWPFG